MKTLAAIGDSFINLDPNDPNTHFVELLRDRYKCSLTNHARGGASNHLIYLQLKELLYNTKPLPDFIICGFTNSNRSIISDNTVYRSHINDSINLNDIYWYNENDLDEYPERIPRFFFSSDDNLVITENLDFLNKKNTELHTRVTTYGEVLPLVQDPVVNQSRDIAIIISCVLLLKEHKIPFTFYCNFYDPSFEIPGIKERYYGVNSEYNAWNYTNTYNFAAASYHTNTHAQEVLADLYSPIVEPYIDCRDEPVIDNRI